VWEFFAEVLRTQGLLALVLLLTIGGLGVAVRHLWVRQNELVTEYEKLLEEMRRTHAKELSEAREQLRIETRLFAERLDALHEKRAQEMQSMVREAVEHIAATSYAVERITDSMSILRDVIRGRD